jgi:tetratricopeptide (TPR) repeat protein
MDLRRSVVPILAGILVLSGCSQIVYFKNAMQAQPRDAEPYYKLGLAYLASSDIESGASHLRKAAGSNPGHTGAQLKLAELLAASRNEELLLEAEKRTRNVLNLLPDEAEALDVLTQAELRPSPEVAGGLGLPGRFLSGIGQERRSGAAVSPRPRY